jgi:hypothetical protein
MRKRSVRKMKEIRSEVEIDCSPDKVWQLLIGSPDFVPNKIREAVKDGRVGSKLKVTWKLKAVRELH